MARATLRLEFTKTQDIEYQNLLQTDEVNAGLRFEFTLQGDLYLLVKVADSELRSFLVGTNIPNKVPQQLEIQFADNQVKVQLGQAAPLLVADVAPSFCRIALGRGFNESRRFHGTIHNANIEIYSQSLGQKVAQQWVSFAIGVLAVFLLPLAWLGRKLEQGARRLKAKRLALLLVVVVFLSFLFRAQLAFSRYQAAVSPDLPWRTDILWFFLQNEVAKDWAYWSAGSPLADHESPLPTYRISVKRENLQRLNAKLPDSGREQFIRGYLKVSDAPSKTYKIQLRYRGEGNFHWFYKQKSLRIKITQGESHQMARKFNLINPQLLSGFREVAYYQKAKDIGLIAPDYHPVRVMLNGEFMGVYMYSSQVDEGLLRARKRMPGSIYYGDSITTQPGPRGLDRRLWYDSGFWLKKGSRNAESEQNRTDIDFFIRHINLDNQAEFYTFFQTYLDADKTFKYIALDRITGSSHHDYSHNHKLYFDPYKGRFEPIAWDQRFWFLDRRKDASAYLLLEQIQFNPLLDFRADQVTLDLLAQETDLQMIALRQQAQQNSWQDLKRDPFKDTALKVTNFFRSSNGVFYSVPFSLSEVEQNTRTDVFVLKQRRIALSKILSHAQFYLHTDQIAAHHYDLVMHSGGNSPVDVLFPQEQGVVIQRIFEGKAIPAKAMERLFGGRQKVANHRTPGSLSNEMVVPAWEQYSFRIQGVSDLAAWLQKVKFTNALTGEQIQPQLGNPQGNRATSLHPWKLPDPAPQTIQFSGTVKITESMEFASQVTVNVQPGTRFLLAPGKSLFFYGRVNMLGQAQAPIHFAPLIPGKPWGVVVVQGPSASHSRFAHVQFQDGSIDHHRLIDYTAPFNIHDVRDFAVTNCYVGKNHLGDDAFHIAYAQGIVKGCLFENAASDALDVDISEVEIRNNTFKDAGNDHLDLMTSKATIEQNVFVRSGDKGISVGEWSEVEINDNIFLANNIGIEVKDKSTAQVKRILIVNAVQKAINLYHKNHSYDDGGTLHGRDVALIGLDLVEADRHSKIAIRSPRRLVSMKSFPWLASLPRAPLAEVQAALETEKRAQKTRRKETQ